MHDRVESRAPKIVTAVPSAATGLGASLRDRALRSYRRCAAIPLRSLAPPRPSDAARSACPAARYTRRRPDDPFAARLNRLDRRTAVPSARATRPTRAQPAPDHDPGAVRSIAAAAPLRRVPRRRFPHRECRPMRSLLTAGRLFLHTPRSLLQEGACARGACLWRALSAPLRARGRQRLVGASRCSGEPPRSCWNRVLFSGMVLQGTARIAPEVLRRSADSSPRFSGEARSRPAHLRSRTANGRRSGHARGRHRCGQARHGRRGEQAVRRLAPERPGRDPAPAGRLTPAGGPVSSRGADNANPPPCARFPRPDRRRSARPGARARRRSARPARPRVRRRACRRAVSTPGCGPPGRSVR